jgi:hypothetical protein
MRLKQLTAQVGAKFKYSLRSAATLQAFPQPCTSD